MFNSYFCINFYFPKSSTIVGVLVLLMVLGSTYSCTIYRSVRYGALPNQNDYKHFAQRQIDNNGAPFCFSYGEKEYKLGSTIGLTNRDLNSTNVSLDSLVQLHKTLSFLIIRNDTILYEYYQEPYSDIALLSSFSMVKPMISTLIGIAIEEGRVRSVEDRIVDYLPEYRNRSGWGKIKVRHLLHHTSGIKFTDGKFSLTSDNAKYYWGNGLRDELSNATLETTPDIKFKYSSVNTQLLGRIIEEVTEGTVSEYLEAKLWKPLGMEAPASWSLDRKDEKAMEKVFCCLQARAIDFAKFGRLYLNDGNWNGQQIVPKKWIAYSTTSDPSGGNKHYYNNNWGLGPMKYGSYFAVGLYGQFLYLYPEKNIIIVRFGNTDTSYHPNYWKETFLQIIDQLESK
ncbi:6-aminohexanoate-dimer hydrolase [Arenibacter sp. NBRC 103722]|uniref:serine hydrolase domain-containing protein n=1 Tax=Arenibacter sp. NBRC 103722 TaxID=1113929 RepID=UPI000853E4F8|nr:serine hydrolase [Arenibacter sp. NBRC 103722]GBF21586.1 6-aminohexanoate-dimer hydrolase [Arenibacter sp. NBRC 103722]